MSQKQEKSAPQGLNGALSEIEKSFGKGSIMYLEDTPGQQVPCLPSGALSLDRALGIGGYPRGRIVEIFGPESSGKTTLTLHAIASVQKAGGTAAFIDAEHAFDIRYAKAIGIDTSKLLVSQPDCGEQALEIAELLTKSGAIDLVVIDSVAALVPRAEIQGDMGDSHMGLQARLMSQALRKLTAVSSRTNTTFIFINQLRQKIGVVFGNPETTTGGNALKFYASVRLDVRRIGKVLVGETVIGNRTRVKVVKNKCAQPFTEAEFDIRWGTGIDAAADLLDVALGENVITKSGAHYSYDGQALGQGKEKARAQLLLDPALQQTLLTRLNDGPAKAAAEPVVNRAPLDAVVTSDVPSTAAGAAALSPVFRNTVTDPAPPSAEAAACPPAETGPLSVRGSALGVDESAVAQNGKADGVSAAKDVARPNVSKGQKTKKPNASRRAA